MRLKALGLVAVLLSIFSLTGCSGGGVSSPNQNAFVAGDGTATITPVKERQSAPVISGETLSGSTFAPKPGEVLVVNVWASWCAPCRAEAPILQDYADKHPGVGFVGILTRDNLTSARSFVKKFDITYPTLIDDSILTRFRKSLIPNAIPSTIVIDANGKIAARISGAVTVAGFAEVMNRVKED